MANRVKEKNEENLCMMGRTWTGWNLIRESLGTSWPLGGSSGSGWTAATAERKKRKTFA
jgi:hypothetical protein